MEMNNFYVSLRHTELINVDEKSHTLPPDNGAFSEFKVIDYFCPEDWSEDGIFVQAKEGQPLWFDFRSSQNNWDCACLCSVQKINPVTNERINLEKGLTKDPKQNYLRLPGQRWIDGFVNNGKVYQFVVTKSGIGMAVNEFLLPEFDQDSHALAFAFFRAKHPKPRPEIKPIHLGNWNHGVTGQNVGDSFNYFAPVYKTYSDCSLKSAMCRGISGQSVGAAFSSNKCLGTESDLSLIDSLDSGTSVCDFDDVEQSIDADEEKQLDQASMGAGGRIKQLILTDNNSVDYYEDKPAAILKVYFCLEEQFESIMKKGKRQDASKKDKFIHSGKIGDIQVPLVKGDKGANF